MVIVARFGLLVVMVAAVAKAVVTAASDRRVLARLVVPAASLADGERVRVGRRGDARASIERRGVESIGGVATDTAWPRLLRPPRCFELRMRSVGPPLPVDRAWRLWLVGTLAATAVAAYVGGALLAVCSTAVLVLALVAALDLGQGRADGLVDSELPALLDMVASSVRSGASLQQALVERARSLRPPLREDLLHLDRALSTGVTLPAALDGWRTRRPTSGVRLTVAALMLAIEVGGDARLIDGVATTLRDRLAIGRELRALTAQARASALVIIVAPVAFMAMVGSGDGELWTFFVRDPLGLACLAGGLLLDGLGGWWMLRIVRRSS